MPMRQVEIAARDVEEAVRLALEQLNRTRDEVDVEILSESDGDEVLVRVTARERIAARPRPDAPRPDVRPEAPRPEVRPDMRPEPFRAEVRPEPRPDYRSDVRPETLRAAAPPPPMPVARAVVPPPADDAEAVLDEYDYERGEEGEESFASPADAVAPIATEILQKLLTQMHFRARILRHDTDDEAFLTDGSDSPVLVLNIAGISEADKGLLIGRRGDTLAALQFIVNLLLGAQTDLWARVIVDVDGYRLRRKEALTSLAERMAERVMAEGQAFPLEPMSAYDRRLVHMALADHPQVMTESTGEGEQRRVVIMRRSS